MGNGSPYSCYGERARPPSAENGNTSKYRFFAAILFFFRENFAMVFLGADVLCWLFAREGKSVRLV
eukprot:879926-Amorphochlora_amoeboformis.AAC.1